MIAGIVERDARVGLDRQAPRLGEVGVAQPVLGAGARRPAEARRPPFAAAAPARSPPLPLQPAGGQRAGEFGAEAGDAGLQLRVEHPPDHDHAAREPLAHAAELGMVELRHGAVAGLQRPHQVAHRVEADAVAVGHRSAARRRGRGPSPFDPSKVMRAAPGYTMHGCAAARAAGAPSRARARRHYGPRRRAAEEPGSRKKTPTLRTGSAQASGTRRCAAKISRTAELRRGTGVHKTARMPFCHAFGRGRRDAVRADGVNMADHNRYAASTRPVRSRIKEGRPYPRGATWDGLGVNFARLLRPRHQGRALPVRRVRRDGDRADRAARIHRRGLARLPARCAARARSTAIASTAPTSRRPGTGSTTTSC